MLPIISFLKFNYTKDEIVLSTREYLNLTKPDFIFLVAIAMYLQNKKTKTKVFNKEQLVDIQCKLFNRNTYRHRFLALKEIDQLLQKEYIIYVSHQHYKGNKPIPFYVVNEEKLNEFYAVLRFFIAKEMKQFLPIKDIKPTQIKNYKLIKSDVLKHITLLKKFKNKK